MVEHLTSGPDDEPVSLDEAKAQLRLETSDDDAFVSTLLLIARKHVESYCNRGLVKQKWEAVLDEFPNNARSPWYTHSCGRWSSFDRWPCQACELFIELRKGQLADLGVASAVESVKYIDLAGVQQTLVLNTDYVVNPVNVPGRVHLAFGKSWPEARRQWDAVRITYSVGWAVDAVPEPIKQGMLLLVSQMYEHRVPEVTGTIATAIKFSFEALLNPYRIFVL